MAQSLNLGQAKQDGLLGRRGKRVRPVGTLGTTPIGDWSLGEQTCSEGYTQNWLASNQIGTKDSEKNSWWSDNFDGLIHVEFSSDNSSPASNRVWLGVGSNRGRSKGSAFGKQYKHPRDFIPSLPTMLVSSSTNPRIPSPASEADGKHVEVENALPPRPPELVRTVSEAPTQTSSPNVQHSRSKSLRPSISGLQSFQRPRKRVPWRGKACIIALPFEDDKAKTEISRYLRAEEVNERFRNWESQGYDVMGFKLSSETPDAIGSAPEGQSRRIFPDPEDMQQERNSRLYRVSIPDRPEWEAHVNRLNEEKLRALGVSFGDEDASRSTTPAFRTASRNTSSLNTAAIAPPSLVSSMTPNIGSHIDPYNQQSSKPSISGPNVASNPPQGYSHHAKPTVAHFPRYSIVMPNGGFPPARPLTRPTPPPSGTLSPIQLYGSQPTTRGASPVMKGQAPSLEPAFSPISTGAYTDGTLAASHGSQQLLAIIQQQQASLQTQQVHQQGQRQGILVNRPRQTSIDGHIAGDEPHPARYNSQAEITSPIPRGHCQNLSEALEKETEDAESTLENNRNGKEDHSQVISHDRHKKNLSPRLPVQTQESIVPKPEREEIESGAKLLGPPFAEETTLPISRTRHVSRPSVTKLNATAPVFEYQPRKPSDSNVFAFHGARPSSLTPPLDAHIEKPLQAEHGGLNVAAPAFVPTNSQKRVAPSREFSFASSGPVFEPDAPVFKLLGSSMAANGPQVGSQTSDRTATRIFGNIEFSEVIKPAKQSKAIPIVRPNESDSDSGDSDGQEDESGRITQPEGRQKRMRRHKNDGDQIPLFAVPSSSIPQAPDKGTSSRSISPLSSATSSRDDITPLENATHQLKEIIDELPASEVSSLTEDHVPTSTKDDAWVPFPFANAQEAAEFNVALPLQSPVEKPLRDVATELAGTALEAIRDFSTDLRDPDATIDDQSRVEGYDDISKSISSVSSSKSSHTPSAKLVQCRQRHGLADVQDFGADPLIDGVTYIDSSYQQIDAVMKELNAEDSDLGVERNISPRSAKVAQPIFLHQTQESSRSHQFPPATCPRSDAPSPSPNRLRGPYQYLPATESESADTVDRELVARNARFSPSYRPSKSDVRRLNSLGSRSISDWDDAISSSEEQKFQTRSSFFDDRIHAIIGDVVQRHLSPLEKNLEVIIKNNIATLSDRPSSRRARRTLPEEAEQSDADDEDEEGAKPSSRVNSPLRDRSYDRLRASIQEIAAAQQQSAPLSQLSEVTDAVNELKTALQQAPKSSGDIKTIVEEAVGRQLRGRSGPITSSHQSATAEKSQLHIDGLESMLKIAEARAEDELKARRATEDALADSQRLLRGALQEAAEQRESVEETERSLASFHEERHETLRRTAMLEGAQESLEKTVAELSEKNAALEDTLEEYRLSSTQWRHEIEDVKAENGGLTRTIGTLKAEIEEGMKGRASLRNRFERLQEDMTMASKDIARDQAIWRTKENEHNAKVDLLATRLEVEARTRECLEAEVSRLQVQEKEAIKTRFVLDQTEKANAELEQLVSQLKAENLEHQQVAARLQQELHDARESARMEVQRAETAMEADVNAARSHVKTLRSELESVAARLQSQIDDATATAADTKARHEFMLEEASSSRQLALRQAAEAREAALQEHYRFHERTVGDLRSQHERALSNVMEDKARSEDHLNQRLALADEKIVHYTDRVAHLEEKLEIARAAAHAAVQAAQSRKSSSAVAASTASLPFATGTDIPEKISPQALRESIMVLQEQLQARESHIEQLKRELSEVDTDAPKRVKSQEMEISWLRELLGVRMDDLQDIVGNLSQPDYNREAVKDAAIRLKTNLQMEQQEKERAISRSQTLPSMASISNLTASPRALPLAAAAAWGNWRKARETSLSSLSGIANGSLNSTPSRSLTLPSAQSFLSGLMTPPSTNVRQTPPQQPTEPLRPNLSRLPLRPRLYSTPRQSFVLQDDERPSKISEPPTTPSLLRQTSYDQDAESASFTGDDASTTHKQAAAEEEPFGPHIGRLANKA